MLLVIAALVAAILIISAVNRAANKDETPAGDTSTVVFDKGKYIVTALNFKTEKNEMSFSYINDEWVYDGDKNFPLNGERVAVMASAIGQISASVIIENNEKPLSDFGLDPAAVTVNATFSNGSVRTFTFGKVNSFNSCQYLMISGDPNVYMVEDTVDDPFSADLEYLYKAESNLLQRQMVTADDVTAITVVTAKEESREITDYTGVCQLYELIYDNLDLYEYEDYYADSTEMKDTYLLFPEGDRVIIEYLDDSGSEKTYTLYIGAKNEPEPENEEEEKKEDESTETTAPESEGAESDTTAPESDTAVPETDTSEGESTEEPEESKYYYFYTFEGSSVVYNADGESVDKIFEFLSYTPTTDEI